MNDYISRKYEILERKIEHLRNPYQRDQIRIMIEEIIENIIDNNDKCDIIDFFKKGLIDSKEKHKQVCLATANCVIEDNYESAFFFLKQELKKIEKNNKSAFNSYIENLTISGTGHFVNTGNINGDIEHNITILKDSGENNIAESFNRIKNLINSENFSKDEKSLLLDNINTLSTQATLEKKDRLPLNVIKTIFSGINVLSSISTIAGIDLQTIFGFFNQ
ncbi:hypothetical protein CMU84_17735 [Elizabethkingia anophelis]|nr:hypothetical protein [Elizabethkingia anophelis]MDV3710156.1 hypothetical protein [Elizabethkingia anophelis]MDV3733627.1 hypothetical protein [Elizabethkingia anophelis]